MRPDLIGYDRCQVDIDSDRVLVGRPTARREAEACKMPWPSHNNFKSIQARALELIHAFEEAIAIVKDYQRELTRCRVPFKPAPGSACHATEAPRGLLMIATESARTG